MLTNPHGGQSRSPNIVYQSGSCLSVTDTSHLTFPSINVSLSFLAVYIFVYAVLYVASHVRQKRRQRLEPSDAESDKGQSH